jgi:hypothetical protein
MKHGRPAAALTFALCTLAVAAAADEKAPADFAASKGVSAEEQLKRRLLARVRTIPGTDTQFLVGGYLQVDGIASRKKQDGDEQDTFIVSTTPFGAANRDYRASIRQSQINWVSRTPSAAGPFWTRLEANLFPLDGTTAPTLNQLYARWDEHLVVGKTYSTFMDESALPTTLDYNGPSGVTFVRQTLVRGRVGIGKGWAIEAALEDPQADSTADVAARSVSTRAARPDLAARVRFESDRGHLQVAGLSRRLDATATGPLGTTERRVDGTGVSVSGSIAFFDADTLMFQTATGKGVGRYFNDPLSSTGVALERDRGGLELVRTSGATLYYQRKWSENWMSVAGASTLWVGTDGLRSPESLRRVVYASANLLHRLTPTLIVGVEALWGEATRVDGASATNVRLQLSVRYLIF